MEKYFDISEIIVSKTDLKGRITYVNDVFERISGFTSEELLGQPHSIIRHPDMPRTIFRLFWEYLQRGEEVFAYVKNICKNGDYYWVLAHATPSFDRDGQVIGYHSNRRRPNAASVAEIEKLYAQLRRVESEHTNARQAADAGYRYLEETIGTTVQSGTYGEWLWDLIFRTGEFRDEN